MSTPASTGTEGRVGRLLAVQATASASWSRSTRNFMARLPHRHDRVHPDAVGTLDCGSRLRRCHARHAACREFPAAVRPGVRASTARALMGFLSEKYPVI